MNNHLMLPLTLKKAMKGVKAVIFPLVSAKSCKEDKMKNKGWMK